MERLARIFGPASFTYFCKNLCYLMMQVRCSCHRKGGGCRVVLFCSVVELCCSNGLQSAVGDTRQAHSALSCQPPAMTALNVCLDDNSECGWCDHVLHSMLARFTAWGGAGAAGSGLACSAAALMVFTGVGPDLP